MEGEQAQPLAFPAAAAVSGVRAFVIADIRGYTAFTSSHGDAEAARLATAFAGLARSAADTNGGRVLELRGDEALAVFESPRAALNAATDLAALCRAHTEADPDLPLIVGIGVDVGEAVAYEDGYRGGALNLAARLCAAARDGEVFASAGVIHLAGRLNGLEYADRGDVRLRGLDSPVRVYQIAREGEMPATRRPFDMSTKNELLLSASITGAVGAGVGLLATILSLSVTIFPHVSVFGAIIAFVACFLALVSSESSYGTTRNRAAVMVLASIGLGFALGWASVLAVALLLTSAGLLIGSGERAEA